MRRRPSRQLQRAAERRYCRRPPSEEPSEGGHPLPQIPHAPQAPSGTPTSAPRTSATAPRCGRHRAAAPSPPAPRSTYE
eukprot:9492536-Pyramimonas_sp.AAC.2